MADVENNCYNADGVNAESVTSRRCFKVGVTFIAAFSIGFVATSMATSTTTEPIDLVGASMQRVGLSPQILNDLGNSPFVKPALIAIEAVNRQTQTGRDVSMQAVRAAVAEMPEPAQAEVAKTEKRVEEKVLELAKTMPGIVAPTGFFDPWGFSSRCSLGTLLFTREAELKHGRIGMIASLGLIVGEKVSPLLGAPSKAATAMLGETPLGQFWPAVFLIVSIPEVLRKEYSYSKVKKFKWWEINQDEKVEMPAGVIPGDYGFDPLGLAPKDPAKFLEIQNKELANGRLAMLATAGIVVQEWLTNQKVF